METKRVILPRFVDIRCYPNKCLTMATGCQIIKKVLFVLNNSWKINFTNFTFSTIFLENNGHRGIKEHVNKVQYCRVGCYLFYYMGFIGPRVCWAGSPRMGFSSYQIFATACFTHFKNRSLKV